MSTMTFEQWWEKTDGGNLKSRDAIVSKRAWDARGEEDANWLRDKAEYPDAILLNMNCDSAVTGYIMSLVSQIRQGESE